MPYGISIHHSVEKVTDARAYEIRRLITLEDDGSQSEWVGRVSERLLRELAYWPLHDHVAEVFIMLIDRGYAQPVAIA